MLSIGSVLAMAAIALVYLNNSGEQTSFITKIVGISLVTFLLLFGALGSSLINNFENRYNKEKLVQISSGIHFALKDDYSDLPESIV